MQNIEKSILKTFFITLGVLFALTVLTILTMSIFFPKIMYGFCSNLGFKNLSFYFAEKQYSQSQNINDLHTTIYMAYDIENNSAIIKYSEILFASPDYEQFIDYINDLNYNSTSIMQARVALTNENNYLLNKYIRALIEEKDFTNAVDFSLEKMMAQSQWDSPQKTTWLLSPLLEKAQMLNDYSFLNSTADNSTQTLMNIYQTYLDKIISAYNELNENSNFQNEFIIATYRYDINNYINHILFLENKAVLELHDFKYYKNIKQNL